jgi:hypothetical protein
MNRKPVTRGRPSPSEKARHEAYTEDNVHRRNFTRRKTSVVSESLTKCNCIGSPSIKKAATVETLAAFKSIHLLSLTAKGDKNRCFSIEKLAF